VKFISARKLLQLKSEDEDDCGIFLRDFFDLDYRPDENKKKTTQPQTGILQPKKTKRVPFFSWRLIQMTPNLEPQ
jgi:hypothetical protein